MERILFFALGYCFGIIQSAYIVGRFYKIDMREHGSKNLGTTNALRTLGAKAGAIVFALDVLKPIAAILIALLIKNLFLGPNVINRDLIVLYTGLGAMIGHNYTFYLGFKGGKGVACSIGMLLYFNPLLVISLFILALGIVYITKYISVASISCSLLAIIVCYFLGYRGETLLVITCMALFIVFKHRANIKRLIQGTENKFTIKKKVV